jgi:hypothetical protein
VGFLVVGRLAGSLAEENQFEEYLERPACQGLRVERNRLGFVRLVEESLAEGILPVGYRLEQALMILFHERMTEYQQAQCEVQTRVKS